MGNHTYVGTIDQGTTGTRFVVFDTDGQPVGDGFEQHTRHTAAPDRVEYDATEIWSCTKAAIQEGIDRAAIDSGDLACLGIANQRQTTVVWDARDQEPVCPAVSWQDRRARELVDNLDTADRTLIRERTGLIADPYFAGPTISHLLANNDRFGAIGDRLRIGTVDSWLLTKLTGNFLTDTTNTVQTMLADVESLTWDEELLEMFDIPIDVLPTIVPSSSPDAYGRTDVDGLLDSSIPVTGVLGNQQAALVGHRGFDTGDTKVSYGSGNFALQNAGQERPAAVNGLLSTIWFHESGHAPDYGLEGPVFTTGTALEWLDDLGLVPESDTLVPEPDAPPSTTGPIVLPGVSGSGAPEWTGIETGSFIGLSRHTSAREIVQGTVDGIGFATRAVLDAIDSSGVGSSSTIFVDGGAIHDDAFAERQARLMDRELVRPALRQTAALGGAFAAGLGANVWTDRDAIPSPTVGPSRFTPDESDEAIVERYREWNAVEDWRESLRSR